LAHCGLKISANDTTMPTRNAGSTSAYSPLKMVRAPATSAVPAEIAVLATTSSMVIGRSPTPARPYPTCEVWASA
jgi:hypothetical protein